MPDPNKKPDGEHIEELLLQLKGIFGHLSESEQEEAKQKITPPARELKDPLPESPPTRPEPPPAPPEPVIAEAPVEPAFSVPEPVVPESPELVSMDTLAATPPPPPIEPQPAPTDPGGTAPPEVNVPPGASLIPTAIFYPAGRDNEARVISQKIEQITPKFTKVAIVLNVQATGIYDAKSDLKSAILSQVTNSAIKAVFVLTEKAMEDSRRRPLIAELEQRGIYFQEIPVHQIEKKALYTDMLLGMVFFFDSQRSASGDSSAG